MHPGQGSSGVCLLIGCHPREPAAELITNPGGMQQGSEPSHRASPSRVTCWQCEGHRAITYQRGRRDPLSRPHRSLHPRNSCAPVPGENIASFLGKQGGGCWAGLGEWCEALLIIIIVIPVKVTLAASGNRQSGSN